MPLSKEELIQRSTASVDDTLEVEIPDVGSVIVKALTRSQALRVADGKNTEVRDAMIVAYGMVEPSMTVREVKEWFKQVPAGMVQALSEQIAEFSGLGDDIESEVDARF